MTSQPLTDDLALAQRIADAADAITMDRFNARDLVVETKPDLTPVSDADKAVERVIRDLVAAERPADGVLGEEYPGSSEPAVAGGSSTRSTAPRTSSVGCRSGPR